MPPVGKKKKQNPISRFVNDIRQSRRGESLVVQTGFPTSLIDLVVKNRSRFVKSKNRYESSNRDKDKDRCRPSPEMKNQENEDSRRIEEEHEKCPDQENQKIYHQEDEKQRKNYGDPERSVKRGLKGRFTKLVKMLFVLILGLGTKKVAAAITLSAFALLFVEFLLRSCVGWKGLRECAKEKAEEEADFVDLNKEFENLVKGNRAREIEIECDKDEECGDETGEESVNGEKMRARVIEFESDKGEEGDKKKGVMIEGDERVLECEKVRCRKKSGGGKITAKQFRKYVKKKFGGDSKSRRRNKDAKLARQNEQSNCDGDGEVESVGKESIGEEQENDQEGDEQDDDVVAEYECKCVSEVSSDVGFQDDIGRKRTNWNLKSLVLVVIILAGLVGGRVMAMVLSIVWFILVVALTKQRKSSATQKL